MRIVSSNKHIYVFQSVYVYLSISVSSINLSIYLGPITVGWGSRILHLCREVRLSKRVSYI